MLKLNYLFADFDLMKKALEFWQHDSEGLDKMFESYRISANATYPFRENGEMRFLRVSPAAEKIKENLLGELEFLEYLREREFPSLRPVGSKNGNLLEIVRFKGEDYYASVFEEVPGIPVEESEFTGEILREYGRTLGKLHRLSSEYKPKIPKWNYRDALLWCSEILDKFSGEEKAKKEVRILKEFFETLTPTKENYGLLHYDYALDNVFFDEKTNSCSVIDFEEGMYHFYAVDIGRLLGNLEEYLTGEFLERAKESALAGYAEEFPLCKEMMQKMSVFRRFCNLYGYVGGLRALDVELQNEPEWMNNFKKSIRFLMEKASVDFGNTLKL